MAADIRRSGLTELADLLEKERQALLDGRLPDLPDIARRKEALAAQLAGRVSDDDRGLADIRERLQRNHRLLSSALEGIRFVSGRLEELQRVGQCLSTYDRSGRRQDIATQARPKLEKRA